MKSQGISFQTKSGHPEKCIIKGIAIFKNYCCQSSILNLENAIQ